MTVENEIGRLKQLQTKKNNNEQLTDEEQKELSNLLKKITTYLKRGIVKPEQVFGISPELDAVIDGLDGGGGGTSPVPTPAPAPKKPEPEPEEHKKRRYKP